MKTLKILMVLVSCMGIVSCDKNDFNKNSVLKVREYVEALKSNNYDSSQLPAFTYRDIPVLLQFRNETQIITNFPSNPISSLHGPECSLGMYVLWTIESIRAKSTNSEYLVMGFPSLNPILAWREAEELKIVSDKVSHDMAAKAYYDWWEDNKHRDFEAFKNIDPLKDTPYKWH